MSDVQQNEEQKMSSVIRKQKIKNSPINWILLLP